MIKFGVFAVAHYAREVTIGGTRTCWQPLDEIRRILGGWK